MLVKRETVNDFITNKIKTFAEHQDLCDKMYDYCYDTFNVPKAITADYLSYRIPVSIANDAYLYALIKTMEVVLKEKEEKSAIPKYFTENEIKEYSVAKFKVDTLEFPLVFDMIEITENQWIGKITYKELIKMRNAQIINYNPDTQRPLSSLTINDKTVYVPTIYPKTVKEIQQELSDGTYIPTPITLNIPIDSNIKFGYDSKKRVFIIKEVDQKTNGDFIEHLDIVDGYHRFLAGCTLGTKDAAFDYPMEFRIVNFSGEKAKKFIFQEEKQTKMKKEDIAGYNTTSDARRVVARLNENSNIAGMIGNKDSLIFESDITAVIEYVYFNKKEVKKEDNIYRQNVIKHLKSWFDAITEYDDKYLMNKYSVLTLLTIVFLAKYFDTSPNKENIEKLDKTIQLVENSNNRYLKNTKLRSKLTDIILEYMKGAI